MRRLRVLLWKEWRQTRSLFAALVIGGAIWLTVAWGLSRSGQYGRVMGFAGGIYLLIAGGTVAATAFASERRLGGLEFLLEKPIGRGRVWLTKVLIALVLSLVLFVGVVVTVCVLMPTEASDESAGLWICLFPAAVSSCFLASARSRRPLLALLLGGPAAYAILAVALVTYPFRSLGNVGCAGAVSLLLLGASWVVFQRARAGGCSRWLGKTAAASAYLAVFSALIAAHVVGLCLAFWSISPHRVSAWWPDAPRASPDGRTVTFAFSSRVPLTEHFGSRCCIVDMATGDLRVLATPKFNAPLPAAWSPDGRFFLHWGYNDLLEALLEPLVELELLGQELLGQERRAYTARILDVRTGEAHELPAEFYEWSEFASWLDEGTLLVFDRAPRPWAYDAADRTLRPVELAGQHRECRLVRIHGGPPGLLPATEAAGPRRVFLYDRESGEWTERPVPHGVRVLRISADGRRAIVLRDPARDADQVGGVEAADLATGTTHRLRQLSYQDRLASLEDYLLPSSGHWVAWRERPPDGDATEILWLCDVRTGRQEAIAQASRLEDLALSPSGRWLCYTAVQPERVRLGKISGVSTDQRVCLHDLWTGDQRTIEEGFAYRAWRFSPDSTKLLKGVCGRSPGLWVLDLATGRTRDLTINLRDDSRVEYWQYEVLPDGVVLLALGRDGLEVYRVRWDGTGQARIYPRDGD